MLLGTGMALQGDLPSIVPIKAWKKVPGFGQIEKGSLPQQGRELGYVVTQRQGIGFGTSSNGCPQVIWKYFIMNQH